MIGEWRRRAAKRSREQLDNQKVATMGSAVIKKSTRLRVTIAKAAASFDATNLLQKLASAAVLYCKRTTSAQARRDTATDNTWRMLHAAVQPAGVLSIVGEWNCLRAGIARAPHLLPRAGLSLGHVVKGIQTGSLFR
jgi:hypothetical protein